MRFLTARLATAAAAVFLAIGSGAVANAATAAGGDTYVVPPDPVTGAAVTAVTSTSLTLEWTNPSGDFSGVAIRRAKGAVPPGFANGTLVTTTAASAASFTDTGLAPSTEYTYALFALGASDSHPAVDIVTGRTSANLAITTESLPEGIAGLTYQAALAASGGAEPYTWTASGLPGGLSMSPDGSITGYPAAIGTSNVIVTVTDAADDTRTAPMKLNVPAALPADCAAESCAQLSPDGQTVHIPFADVSQVTRDPVSNAVTQVVLTGISVASGDVLVLAPGTGIPSGLIDVAGTVTDNGDGTVTVAVTTATPGDAYDSGVVQVLGAGATTITADVPGSGGAQVLGSGMAIGSGAAAPAVPSPSLLAAGSTAPGAPSPLSCTGGVSSSLLGLSVTHTLTPSLAAIWKHPYFGGGGVYIGSGGLSLFQFDLDGTITLNMGIAVSGAATCTLTLPELKASLPAGDLGAVIFATTPELTFTVTGAIDMRSTISLNCGAEYRWFNGTESRIAYCEPASTPLQLDAGSGLDATLKGTLDASVTLDDIAGITGDVWAQAHAGYHPAQHPEAELDASAGWDLGACLACFWKGSPATVSIGSGTFFSKTLATYDTAPAGTPPVITSSSFPDAIVGQSYTAALSTADERAGTWQITGGVLPPGLSLSGSAINGTPTTAGTYPFTLTFTDSSSQTAQAATTLTVDNSVGGGGGGGAGGGGGGGNPTWSAVSTGFMDACAIRSDGTLWCWGDNEYGELGTGDYSVRVTPTQVGAATNWATVASGTGHTCGIRTDGTLWCWGDNDYGELGAGDTITRFTPTQVGTGTNWAAVSTGDYDTCATQADGTLWCWGINSWGQLGTGGYSNQLTPTQVGTGTTWSAVAAGVQETCATQTDDTLWCWGRNDFGELGTGDTVSRPTPSQVGIAADWQAVSAGAGYTCAVRTDGTLWCWGDNSYGELGTGDATNYSTPTQVGTAANWAAVSATGDNDVCATRADGTLWCWGLGGALGTGDTASRSTPTQVGTATGWVEVSTGQSHTCATQADGTLWCWGYNEAGDLGEGSVAQELTPTQVS